ncbi:MAG: histidine phosphatase family protein [Clostridia bacterium]|nr:histidine phosphatase family protein [Clostridia bacterium]
MKLLLIRHADPDYEIDGLTEKGHKEAKLLAERLKKEKIAKIYSSPFGRAMRTAEYTANACNLPIIEKEFLREFHVYFDPSQGGRKMRFPWKEARTAWDMLPGYWTKKKEFYDAERWHQADVYRDANMQSAYTKVVQEFDALLAEHGYVRENGYYRVENPNTQTIALFCHFGIETVLLSHLFGTSPVPLWQGLVALPSSVTTLHTEERRKGIASFRCCGFGDIGHLYAGGEAPSFAARFCEIFDSDDRHD